MTDHPADGKPPMSKRELRREVEVLAEQVRRLRSDPDPQVERDRLLAGVITMAELAAGEIRAAAEREAAAIRLRAGEAIAQAQAAIERHRQALAELEAETTRIDQAIAGLRAQTVELEAERRRVEEALSAARGAASAGGA